jgi:hypothetical protein
MFGHFNNGADFQRRKGIDLVIISVQSFFYLIPNLAGFCYSVQQSIECYTSSPDESERHCVLSLL